MNEALDINTKCEWGNIIKPTLRYIQGKYISCLTLSTQTRYNQCCIIFYNIIFQTGKKTDLKKKINNSTSNWSDCPRFIVNKNNGRLQDYQGQDTRKCIKSLYQY